MMKRRPDFEGFLKVVLGRAEADRVPFVELFHDWEIMVAIQGAPTASPEDADAYAAWQVRFWLDLGYDYVSQGVNMSFPASTLAAEDTAALSRGKREWASEGRGPISNWEEFDAYPWPQVTPAAFQELERVRRHLPEGMKAVAMLPGGPFENLMFLMGFGQLSYALVDQPDLVAAIAERVGETLCAVVENTTSMEWVGAQWLNDDMGFKTALLVAPEVLRRYVFPTQRRICELSHAHGKPVFLHSCGKLDEIMDELIDDIGIDAKHSFEDVIMPVREAKQKWGSRIGLLGGVDMSILAAGTEEEVRAYTRHCLEACMPGGGWALGSGNTVANYLPVANFLAMLDEGRRWRG